MDGDMMKNHTPAGGFYTATMKNGVLILNARYNRMSRFFSYPWVLFKVIFLGFPLEKPSPRDVSLFSFCIYIYMYHIFKKS